MKCWAVSDTGDKWSVGLDVRDLGGHLDSTLRAQLLRLVIAFLLLFTGSLLLLSPFRLLW